MKHLVYTGYRSRGLMMIPFGKCLCGAVLEGKEDIERHAELMKNA